MLSGKLDMKLAAEREAMSPKSIDEIVSGLRMIGTDKQSIEVKSGVGKDILETLSAFSNGSGGLIIVGLSEKDGFQPVPHFEVKRAQDQLETRCDQLSPPVRPIIDLLPFEGSTVLVAKVPELASIDKPCYVTAKGQYNGSYIRTGDGDVHLSKYEIDRLLEEKTQPRWDEQPVVESTIDDLDSEQLERYLDLQRERRPKTFSGGNDAALKRLRILRENHPTLASLLVLGEYPQEFYPRLTASFALFPGTRKGEITEGQRLLDSRTLTGSIPEIVNAAIKAVSTNMRTGALIEGAFRRDLPDYPPVAVREAVVNALMHRDYSPTSLGSPVHINMFVDRLEISNPGGLYGGVTLRSLGEPGVSSTRNQRIATLLEDVSFPGGGVVAENRGTGIDTMNKALTDALMPPPHYSNRLDSFTVTFYRRRVAPQEEYGTARDLVLARLETAISASTTEIVAQTKLSRSAVQQAINSLIKEGLAERTEPARSPKQRYRIRSDRSSHST